MVLAIANTTPRPIGPGYTLMAIGMPGPTPIDDYVTIHVHPGPSSPNVAVYGISRTSGETFAKITLGVDERGVYERFTLDQLAAGASVYLTVYHQNGNSTLVEGPIIYTGWTWDPTTQAATLAAISASREREQSVGQLAEILAAVRKTY